METYPGLALGVTVVVAFGIISIAAVELSNAAGLRLYDKKKIDRRDESRGTYYEYLYDTDEAERLRVELRRFTQSLRSTYWFFSFAVIGVAIIGLDGIRDSSIGGSLFFQNKEASWKLELSEIFDFLLHGEYGQIFIFGASTAYVTGVVTKIMKISSKLYGVIRIAK